ncbi:pyrroline-5-carboxylate reductase [Coprococcus sp. HCN-4056]|uniref:pyrroline-5-carboxylate reductase n=1 Tax=Coprococcus sp. HCN-4056 TaxID=3134671 RepID=UPI0030C4B765
MKIGFIGCGNMATSIIKGIIRKQIIDAENIIASAKTKATLDRVQKELGVKVSTDNLEVTENSDILVLAVKPQYYPEVIAQIKDVVRKEQIVISIAPGKTLDWLQEQFGGSVRLVRTMPNTPALVGEGMTGACRNEYVTDEDYATVLQILGSFGEVETIPENLMDVCVSVSGSSPAYIYILIEAMADGAVVDGMPRAQAYKFAAQSVLGSAKMVLETGKHPGELKDQVCSPGGTTIEAVRVLEEKGFRSSVIEAMKACVRKARGI